MLKNLDIAVLRTFVEVAHAGSFTKATEKSSAPNPVSAFRLSGLRRGWGRRCFSAMAEE